MKLTNKSNKRPSRVKSRLLRVFVLQLALISLITVAGIFAASLVAERILVNRALVGEAGYFWNQRAEDASFPLPNTLNLQSWFTTSGIKPQIPTNLAELPVGQHRVMVDDDDRIVYVSERDGDKLYLLFQDETVSNLAFYFGIVPLAFVLLVMYSLAFLAYWLSKRAVSPIASLADYIERFDFSAQDASELDLAKMPDPRDSETLVLARALEHFIERSKVSIERERNFTRYASHELRTPIAVIQGSISSLELVGHEGAAGRAVQRIKRSSGQMAQLIDSLLLLARDRNSDDVIEAVDIFQLLHELIDELQMFRHRDEIDVVLDPHQSLVVHAPVAVISIVLGNILRNAWKYTETGQISVRITDAKVSITDTGGGLTEEQQRRIFEPFYRIDQGIHSVAIPVRAQPTRAQVDVSQKLRLSSQGQIEGLGLGLAIVRHFCDIYAWRVTVTSEVGSGSCFSVEFPQTTTQVR
ncbi:MAG: sensor histidine kinase [Granulosicoccus sp.]